MAARAKRPSWMTAAVFGLAGRRRTMPTDPFSNERLEQLRMRPIAFIDRCCLALLALAGWLLAQIGRRAAASRCKHRRRAAAAKTRSQSQTASRVTPEREAAVMTFVQRNHAELAELLAHLKVEPARGIRAGDPRDFPHDRAAGADPGARSAAIRAGSRGLDGPVARAAAGRQAEDGRRRDELKKQLREALGAQNEPGWPCSSTSGRRRPTG